MDYETAYRFLINQGTTSTPAVETFLLRLKQGKPPIPGQVTSILLALKVVFEALRDSPTLDRELADALFLLSWEGRQQFEAKRKAGVSWPPLLDEDLVRIALATKSIFSGVWYGS